MNWNLNGQSADVEQALAGGSPQRAGWFRFHFADQRWEWSEQVRRMHGYEPGSVTPTTDLVLAHKHPDDRRQVAATIDQILNTHKAFSTRHRIIDTSGNVRSVVVVGDQLHEDQGGVIGTHGFYVDVSPLPDQEREDLVTTKLAEITEQRASIEQAKGAAPCTRWPPAAIRIRTTAPTKCRFPALSQPLTDETPTCLWEAGVFV
jgi:PAS domain S-box-containing protein